MLAGRTKENWALSRVAGRSVLWVLGVALVAWGATAAWRAFPSTAPTRAPDGSKWRIAYYEGGEWPDYLLHTRALVRKLMAMGWIEYERLPDSASPEDTRAFWKWLSTTARSDYLTFVPDAFWSADWDDAKRAQVTPRVIERLNSGDIDLVLALGTWAGQDLANNRHHVPTIVMSTSDPIRAGIIKSAEDSGFDHVHAACDPARFRRQVRVFHRLTGFRRIGVVHEGTPAGITWANVADLEAVGRERGFEVLQMVVPEIGRPDSEVIADARRVYAEMAPKIDALWVSSLLAEKPPHLSETLQPMFRNKVRTWSQWGPTHARCGVLFATTREDTSESDDLYARTLAAIFHGARPRDLPQPYEDRGPIVVNTEVARRIGYKVPPGLLASAAKIVKRIEPCDDGKGKP